MLHLLSLVHRDFVSKRCMGVLMRLCFVFVLSLVGRDLEMGRSPQGVLQTSVHRFGEQQNAFDHTAGYMCLKKGKETRDPRSSEMLRSVEW